MDGGSTDGYYAVLEGANFGEGCGKKNGGSCLKQDEETGKFTGLFDFNDPKLMGMIRYMKMAYDRNDNKQYDIFELDASTMSQGVKDGWPQEDYEKSQRANR